MAKFWKVAECDSVKDPGAGGRPPSPSVYGPQGWGGDSWGSLGRYGKSRNCHWGGGRGYGHHPDIQDFMQAGQCKEGCEGEFRQGFLMGMIHGVHHPPFPGHHHHHDGHHWGGSDGHLCGPYFHHGHGQGHFPEHHWGGHCENGGKFSHPPHPGMFWGHGMDAKPNEKSKEGDGKCKQDAK